MLKATVKRGLLLDFIPDKIQTAANVNINRIFQLNSTPISSGGIYYYVTREFRVEDNWALQYSIELSENYNKKLTVFTIIENIKYSKQQEPFFYEGLENFKDVLKKNNIKFEIFAKMPENAGALVVDFNPVSPIKTIPNYTVFEVDSHNIIPTRFISQKQEYSAATLRKKNYENISTYLTEFPNKFNYTNSFAKNKLNKFINKKLNLYQNLKNDPNEDVCSGLSPYLHFGFISAQRITLEVLKSGVTRDNIEAFLEELIVRKELSDNFCHYAKSFTSMSSAPNWALNSLLEHNNDLRAYVYLASEFETAQTHDALWNTIQLRLVKTGYIHGYLRMYWAKKILEWGKSSQESIDIAIYLNDKYAMDGNDSNGYVGILWSICGLHDRAFTNRLITGKIRYMGLSGCYKKFDVKKFIRENS